MSDKAENKDEEGRFWIRECKLIVGKDNGEGLDLSSLRITFKTKKGDAETPNSAEINVYNLSDETASKIKKEFTQVFLEAGYVNNVGLIFRGNIRQVRIWRENGVDKILSILAADGDKAYNFATVNKTLAAGSRPADRVGVCQESFKEKGAGESYAPDPGGEALPRGKVMYGMARKYMRDEARNTDSEWSFQDGKMQMVSKTGYLPGEAVVLTSETGLIGTPEQTNDGINLKALLNPKLKIGGRIKLDNASIKEAQSQLGKAGGDKPVSLDSDGFYRIIKIDYSGDTRGNDWYADITCVGMDETTRKTTDK